MPIERKQYKLNLPIKLFEAARKRAIQLEKTFVAYIIGLIEADLKKEA
jgi:hypothetical protein